MIEKNDWRLTNQEIYLKNVQLIFKNYKDRISNTDHDHCEFCLEKFSEDKADLNFGYCTEDGYYWICSDCYNDFHDLFGWKLGSSFPYKEYQNTKLWYVINQAIDELVENLDIQETNDRKYIVGYLCKSLSESGFQSNN
jgi:hypothetical protein